MGLFDRFKKSKKTHNAESNSFGIDLPQTYLSFLKDFPNGTEIAFNEHKDENPTFEGRYWNIMGKSELLESWEMNGVGKARNFECLKLYVQAQRDMGQGDYTTSNTGKVSLKRVENGFVIGDENGDYLYLDPNDNYSVWIYYHNGGDILKISDSFDKFIKE